MLNVEMIPVVESGFLYLRRDLQQVYSRPGEYLSLSQVSRRLKANCVDTGVMLAVIDKINQHSRLVSRKHTLEKQSFRFSQGKRPGTLELKCYDASSISQVDPTTRAYVTIRLRIYDETIMGILDVL